MANPPKVVSRAQFGFAKPIGVSQKEQCETNLQNNLFVKLAPTHCW